MDTNHVRPVNSGQFHSRTVNFVPLDNTALEAHPPIALQANTVLLEAELPMVITVMLAITVRVHQLIRDLQV